MLRHVTVEKLAELSGYPAPAIHEMIAKGQLREGVEWKKTPNNIYMIDLLMWDKWCESGYDAEDDSSEAVIFIKDYLEDWFKQKEKVLKNSTLNNYRKIIYNRLIPQFGDKKLHELKRADVRDWCNTLNVSNKTISNLISPLRDALQDACDNELIDRNPLADWSYRKKEAPNNKENKDPFSKDEQEKIIEAIAVPENQNLIRFLFWTGLRTSEVIALQWSDIDETKQQARISKAKTQVSDEIEQPKTQAGNRVIKLLPPALAAIKQQKAFTFGHESGCVFIDHKTGESWCGDQPIRKKLWIPALKHANVRYRNPYQTRHTFASMMLSSGENISWLSQQLGHTDTRTTLKAYARWLPDANPQAGMKAVKHFT